MRLLFWRKRPVPVLQLHGTLTTREGALNIATYGKLIGEAMDAAESGGTLVLDIDSPGGSPVQSDLIANRIRRLADEKKVKIVAVIGEVGASGGYWLACAGEEIVANPMSVVGSIGVVGGGFGFGGALARLGVRRRLYTAGTNKARLDPFLPETPEDLAFVTDLMSQLHERFKAWVRARRGKKLPADEEKVFDGGWMLGERALTMGLIDRLGDLDSEVRRVGGDKARTQMFRPGKRGLLAWLPRLMAEAVAEVLDGAGRPRI
jgi:signal peptide peptidase SppA